MRCPTRLAFVMMLALAACQARQGPPGTEYCQVVSDFVTPADCEDFGRQAALQSDGRAAFNAPNPIKRGDSFSVSLAVADQPDAPPPPDPAPPGDTAAPPDDIAAAVPDDVATGTAPADNAVEPPVMAGNTQVASVTYPARPQPPVAPTPGQVIEPMPGRKVEFDAVVGPRMAAELLGDEGFEITPADGDPKHKVLRMGPPYTSVLWTWNVKARRGGVHTLSVRTVVEAVDSRGGFHELVSTPAVYSFNVVVTPWQQFWDTVADAPKKIESLTAVVVALTALATALVAFWAVFRRKRKKKAALPESHPPD